MEKFHLAFCDGACSGNPGPGGWGFIVLVGDSLVVERGGREEKSTNNRMEITALSESVRLVLEYVEKAPRDTHQATFRTDSRYVIQGITQWIHGWRRNGWKTATGGDVSNLELWEALWALWSELKRKAKVDLQYVAGHSGIVGNERADEIATGFARGDKVELFHGPSDSYGVDLKDLTPSKTPPKKKSGERALGYLSVIDGKAIRHKTWASCEKRVKGKAKALYRKYANADEEKQILTSWGVFPHDVKEE